MIHRAESFRRWVLPIVFMMATLVVLATPPETAAQTALEQSDPQPSSVLADSPAEIRLQFSGAVDAAASSVRVLDIEGNTLPDLNAESGEDDHSLVVPVLQPLENGSYTVAWAIEAAADGEASNGYFTFTVGSQSGMASVSVPTIEQSTGAPPWLQAVSRWLVLLTLAVAIAVWPIWLIALWPAGRGDASRVETLAQRAQTIGLAAIALAMLANVLALVVEAMTLTRGSLVTRIGDTLFDSRYGRLWLARVGLLLLLALVLRFAPWTDPIGKRYLAAAVIIVALLVPVPVALDSHASALDTGRWTAIVFDYVHLVSASLWFGGLVLLAGVLLRGLPNPIDRRRVLAQAMPRFSSAALVCWGLLAVSGIYAAWLQVGSWEALRTTQYGQSLLVKLAIVALVLLIALVNLLVITRKLARTDAEAQPKWFGRLGYALIAELVLTTLILLAVGRMTSLPPGREVLAAKQLGETVHFNLDDRDVTLQFAPGAAGPNHFLVSIPGDPVPLGTEALLRVTFTGDDIGSNVLALARSGSTVFETHGSDLGIAGEWEVELLIRKVGQFEWIGSQVVVVGSTGSPTPEPPWRLGTGGIVGLLLIGIALAGFVVAWRAGKSRLRIESAGLGVVAALLGLMLMAQARIQPTGMLDLGMANPVAATNDSVTRGAELYSANCLYCHGVAGQGDGPNAAGMAPPPADFTAPHTWAHPDAQLFEWIQNGKPGTAMPGFMLTDEQIWDLINYIQVEFQGKPMVEGSPVASPEAMIP